MFRIKLFTVSNVINHELNNAPASNTLAKVT